MDANTSVYFTPEHELLRDQVARFLAREVEPHADRWEEQGGVPRDVLRRMGQAGLLGLMFEPGLWRRRCRRHDQPGVRRGAEPVHLRRLPHHGAGAHRHGQPAPAPRGHDGTEGKVPAR
jgi:alkylation response protein AidB-like acyl-CoA dehydrogenase